MVVMTKREAAIISAHTETQVGDLDEMYQYVYEIMGRTVYTHELVHREIWNQIKAKSKPDFDKLEVVWSQQKISFNPVDQANFLQSKCHDIYFFS